MEALVMFQVSTPLQAGMRSCLLPASPPGNGPTVAGPKPACLAAAAVLLAVTMHAAPAEHLLVAAAPQTESGWGSMDVKQQPLWSIV